uniref:Uncharacterized protein n=1 Tax=Romanomermis culicivorax TaxID=13658 RepID=A0A915L837_ROMCU
MAPFPPVVGVRLRSSSSSSSDCKRSLPVKLTRSTSSQSFLTINVDATDSEDEVRLREPMGTERALKYSELEATEPSNDLHYIVGNDEAPMAQLVAVVDAVAAHGDLADGESEPIDVSTEISSATGLPSTETSAFNMTNLVFRANVGGGVSEFLSWSNPAMAFPPIFFVVYGISGSPFSVVPFSLDFCTEISSLNI